MDAYSQPLLLKCNQPTPNSTSSTSGVTRNLLDADRKVATDVLLALKYQLSRRTSSIEVDGVATRSPAI